MRKEAQGKVRTMTRSRRGESILAEIFTHETGTEDWGRETALSPSFKDIKAFAGLLGDDPPEEQLQGFLTKNPRFLIANFGYADSATQAFIAKPKIGTQFVADFVVLICSQGGFSFNLVELEPAHVPLFTKAGTPARRHQGAIGQVQDWKQWIDPNFKTFATDTLVAAKALPQWPRRSHAGSFRLCSPEALQGAWEGFGGLDVPLVHYTVVCGRWARLSPRERERLVMLNKQNRSISLSTCTYDQLARNGFVRPYTSF
jgi:hypothetical protein